MEFSGILGTAGLLICLPLVWLAIIRFKDLRVRRILGTLEWLAINTGDRSDRNIPMPDLGAAETWGRAHWVFASSLPAYMRLVWNARLRDLYWANRFGAELQRLSLFPVPYETLRRDEDAGRRREQIISVHIRDFLILAQAVLRIDRRPEVEHGER